MIMPCCRVDIDAELAKIDQQEGKDKTEKKTSGTSLNKKMQHIPDQVDTSGMNILRPSNVWRLVAATFSWRMIFVF